LEWGGGGGGGGGGTAAVVSSEDRYDGCTLRVEVLDFIIVISGIPRHQADEVVTHKVLLGLFTRKCVPLLTFVAGVIRHSRYCPS